MTHIPDAHSAHDQLLLAAFAAGDLPEAAAADATRLAASCSECAELVADLRAIARATAALPAPARRRDFRLSAADAARLRGPIWRRALSSVIAPRFSFTRPLAAALTTLGIAGLLLASLPAGFTGGSTAQLSTGAAMAPDQASAAASAPALAAPAMSAPAAGGGQAGASGPIVGAAPSARSEIAPVPAASAAPATGAPNASSVASPPTPNATAAPAGALPPAPSSSPGPEAATNPVVGAAPVTSSPGPQVFAAASPAAPADSSASSAGKSGAANDGRQGLEAQRAVGASGQVDVSPLVVLSLVFLVGGVGLFGLRFVARRLARG